MVVMAPKDENELRRMLKTALNHNGPIAVRYPRGRAQGVCLDTRIRPIPIGEAEILENGSDILILAVGRPVGEALAAHTALAEKGISSTVINCRFVKPLDSACILEQARKIPRIITIEENVLAGGFGCAVAECLVDAGMSGFQMKRIGIPDVFVEHGSQKHLRARYGIDAANIIRVAESMLS